jgi:hypothetical protein
VEEHAIVADASSVARARCRPAICRYLPRLEFGHEATAAAARPCIMVPSATPESTGSELLLLLVLGQCGHAMRQVNECPGAHGQLDVVVHPTEDT